VSPPSSLASICRGDDHDRLVHTYGKSFPDYVRLLERKVPAPPDFVAYPPRQKPASFNLDSVLETLQQAGSGANH
jgi:alkyldihydroxyacetonephosphate synthase